MEPIINQEEDSETETSTNNLHNVIGGDDRSVSSAQSMTQSKNDASDDREAFLESPKSLAVNSWSLRESKQAQSGHATPIFVRFSVRVHHIYFVHPSLSSDPQRESIVLAKKSERGIKKFKKGKMSVNADVMSDKNDRKRQNIFNENQFHKFASLSFYERKRLSRDGVIRDHINLQRNNTSPQDTGSKNKNKDEETVFTKYQRSYPKGRRELILSSFSSYDPKEAGYSLPVDSKRPQSSHNISPRLKTKIHSENKVSGTNLSQKKKSDLEHDILYSGKGFEYVDIIKNTNIAKVGRFLPNTACFVPNGGICFKITNYKGIRMTHPFVVNSPHTIWGSGRDGILSQTCLEGNPLVDQKDIEYVPDHLLDRDLNKKSLLVVGTMIWVRVEGSSRSKSNDKFMYGGKQTLKVAKRGAKGIKKGAKIALKAAHLSKKNNDKRISMDLSVGKSHIEESQEVPPRDSVVRFAPLEDDSISGRGSISNDADDLTTPSNSRKEEPLYVVENDDILKFQVIDFESGKPLGSFPISVAAVLNSRSKEDFINDPRKPGEITVVLTQDASAVDEKWGLEVKVTFRCAEVERKPELESESHDKAVKYMRKLGVLDTRLDDEGNKQSRKIRRHKKVERALEKYLDEETKIINSGSGKGYERGAPERVIFERQIFFDKECRPQSKSLLKRIERIVQLKNSSAILKSKSINRLVNEREAQEDFENFHEHHAEVVGESNLQLSSADDYLKSRFMNPLFTDNMKSVNSIFLDLIPDMELDSGENEAGDKFWKSKKSETNQVNKENDSSGIEQLNQSLVLNVSSQIQSMDDNKQNTKRKEQFQYIHFYPRAVFQTLVRIMIDIASLIILYIIFKNFSHYIMRAIIIDDM